MRKKVISLTVVGVALMLGIVPVRAQSTTSTTIITIPMNASARVLDAGNQPSNWQALSIDETGWNAPTPVSDDVRNCLAQRDSGWNSDPAYWGADQSRSYLVRFTITVPTAANYYDSVITGASNDVSTVYVNGSYVTQLPQFKFQQIVIAPYLHPGKNIVAVSAIADTFGNPPFCNALSLTVTIHLNGITMPHAGPQGLQLTWRGTEGSAYYYLQIWLAKAAAGQLVTAASRASLTRQVTGTHYTLNTQAMPKGLYQWRIGAVTAQGSLISWSSPHSFTLK